MTFGEKIKFLRKQLNITQTEFADKLYVTRQSVQKWEVDLSSPDISKLKEISSILGVSIDVLLDDSITEIDLLKIITKEEEIKQEEVKVDQANKHYSALDYLILIPTWLGIYILIGMGYMFGAMLVGILCVVSIAGPVYGIYSIINLFTLTEPNQILVSVSMIFIGLGIGYPAYTLTKLWINKYKTILKWLNNKSKSIWKGIRSCIKN